MDHLYSKQNWLYNTSLVLCQKTQNKSVFSSFVAVKGVGDVRVFGMKAHYTSCGFVQ
jgi:hypothetical protein